MKATFKFPKTVMTVAGAAAMVASTGFITANQSTVSESSIKANSLRVFKDWDCKGSGGNCLPTVVIIGVR